MALNKDVGSLAAGAVDQSHSPLFQLPAELFDQIMDHLFIFRSPIEFSPIESRKDMGRYSMGPCQYQHALDFQNHIRPALRALRTCKVFFSHGAHRYYSRNCFRFSSQFGWAVMARFLDLIGLSNITLLRDVTVVHPFVASEPIYEEGTAYFVHRLSPFGMADTKDYHKGFLRDDANTAQLARMEGLTQLTFLLYPRQNQQQHFPPTHMEFIQEFAGLGGFGGHVVVPVLDWKPSTRTRVTLINLCPMFRATTQMHRPVLLQSIQAGDAQAPDERSAVAARGIIAQMLEEGWTIEDKMLCQLTGVWPVTEKDYETSDEEWMREFCDDIEGWNNRETITFEYFDPDDYDDNYYDEKGKLSSQPWQYQGCVRCWRDSCTCKDGGKYLPQNWNPIGHDVGNPGVPIEVDFRGHGGVIWQRSEAMKDFDDWWASPGLRVFNLSTDFADSTTETGKYRRMPEWLRWS